MKRSFLPFFIVIIIITLIGGMLILVSISKATPHVKKTANTTYTETKQAVQKLTSEDYIYAKKKCSVINTKKIAKSFLLEDLCGDFGGEIYYVYLYDCSPTIYNNEPIISCKRLIGVVKCNNDPNSISKCYTSFNISCITKETYVFSSTDITDINVCR